MDSDQKSFLIGMLIVFGSFLLLIWSVQCYYLAEQRQVLEAIKLGASPVQARCAVKGIYSELLCSGK